MPQPVRHGDVHRLFFALWPDAAARAGMAKAAARLGCGQGRPVKSHRYHLTLHYLGDFDALPQACAESAIAAASRVRAPAFDLVLDRAGSFRNRSIPWWLGCVVPDARLQLLGDGLGLELARAGVHVQSGAKLVPHVTVLRDAAAALPDRPIAPIVWQVREFVLIHSQLGTRNAYDLLGRWPLPA